MSCLALIIITIMLLSRVLQTDGFVRRTTCCWSITQSSCTRRAGTAARSTWSAHYFVTWTWTAMGFCNGTNWKRYEIAYRLIVFDFKSNNVCSNAKSFCLINLHWITTHFIWNTVLQLTTFLSSFTVSLWRLAIGIFHMQLGTYHLMICTIPFPKIL